MSASNSRASNTPSNSACRRPRMPKFEDLQTLWQRQPVRRIPAHHAAELTGAFRCYGRRRDVINTIKLVIVAADLAFLAYYMRHRPMMLLGACIAIFSSIFFLLCDWRAQRSIARLNFADSSIEFL